VWPEDKEASDQEAARVEVTPIQDLKVVGGPIFLYPDTLIESRSALKCRRGSADLRRQEPWHLPTER